MIELLFWFMLFVVFYSYAGYGILLFVVIKFKPLKRLFFAPANSLPNIFAKDDPYTPNVTLIISASGERSEVIKEKIQNTLNLDYPADKLEVIFALAYDTSEKVDETVEEFYNNFLKAPEHSFVSSKDEEVYVKFIDIEDMPDNRDDRVLDEIEKRLEAESFSSGDISLNAKHHLDKMSDSSRNEISILVTKDVRRKGKISQVNRTVKKASGEIIVFSDANAMFNAESIKNIVKHFANTSVGVVAGEKRVKKSDDSTSGEGEGMYWKYESKLKKWDYELYSAVGAAGEIFAIRKELWDKTSPEGALIEDFVVSMQTAQMGYKIAYEPEAYAEEEPTFDLYSEYVRRRRISAGGFQSIVMLKSLLNIFYYRTLSFQYISHRVLRWAVTPFFLPLLIGVNAYLAFSSFNLLYVSIFAMQMFFYVLALVGWKLELQHKKIKIFYFPFLLCMMNFSAYAGLKRYIRNEQKVVWERVKR